MITRILSILEAIYLIPYYLIILIHIIINYSMSILNNKNGSLADYAKTIAETDVAIVFLRKNRWIGIIHSFIVWLLIYKSIN
jgi:hypothetical protein